MCMLLLVLKILHNFLIILCTHNVTIFTNHHFLCCINCPGVKRLYNNAVFWMDGHKIFAYFAIGLSVSIALIHVYMQEKNA